MFKYHAGTGSSTVLATSSQITVNDPLLKVDTVVAPTVVNGAPSDVVQIDLIGGEAHQLNWIGMFRAGETDNDEYEDWFYLNGTKTAPSTGVHNASFPMTLPNSRGKYEFKLPHFETLRATSTTVVASSPMTPRENGMAS